MSYGPHDGLPPDHVHPTWGICLCGHRDMDHAWTEHMRVDFLSSCSVEDCPCPEFHIGSAV